MPILSALDTYLLLTSMGVLIVEVTHVPESVIFLDDIALCLGKRVATAEGLGTCRKGERNDNKFQRCIFYSDTRSSSASRLL